ncbi:U4/U6-U5 snRNP complex subunit LSM8 [Rhodotorula sphaerocarpa]
MAESSSYVCRTEDWLRQILTTERRTDLPAVPSRPAPLGSVFEPQGKLIGFDQTTNVILSDSVERIFSPDEPVIEEPLGVEIVRGDNIVSLLVYPTLIGSVDEEADKEIDLSTIRAHPLADVTH